jgi:ubiquitin C-terminal hydrolase
MTLQLIGTTESLDLTVRLCCIQGTNYELVATITHHGRDPYRVHYTAHAKHANEQWLRFDDYVVVPVARR